MDIQRLNGDKLTNSDKKDISYEIILSIISNDDPEASYHIIFNAYGIHVSDRQALRDELSPMINKVVEEVQGTLEESFNTNVGSKYE